MDSIRFVSFDPSLRNTGVCYGTIDAENNINVKNTVLLSTESEKNKRVRVSTDTINRSREIYKFLQQTIEEWKPNITFVETPSGSQNASSMKSYGVVCALISTVTPIPIEVTPIEVKQAFIGSKTATKQQIIDKAVNLYPDAGWLKKGGRILKKNEHCADAVAIVFAGVKTVQFKQIVNFLKTK